MLEIAIVLCERDYEEVEQAWRLFQNVYNWFMEPWNLARHCWGMCLAGPAAELQQLFCALPGRRNKTRAAQLKALLQGKSLKKNLGEE